MNTRPIARICFDLPSTVSDVLSGSGLLQPAAFDEFVKHVIDAASLYREIVNDPPGGMTSEETLRALTDIPSHRLTSSNREERDRLLKSSNIRRTPETRGEALTTIPHRFSESSPEEILSPTRQGMPRNAELAAGHAELPTPPVFLAEPRSAVKRFSPVSEPTQTGLPMDQPKASRGGDPLTAEELDLEPTEINQRRSGSNTTSDVRPQSAARSPYISSPGSPRHQANPSPTKAGKVRDAGEDRWSAELKETMVSYAKAAARLTMALNNRTALAARIENDGDSGSVSRLEESERELAEAEEFFDAAERRMVGMGLGDLSGRDDESLPAELRSLPGAKFHDVMERARELLGPNIMIGSDQEALAARESYEAARNRVATELSLGREDTAKRLAAEFSSSLGKKRERILGGALKIGNLDFTASYASHAKDIQTQYRERLAEAEENLYHQLEINTILRDDTESEEEIEAKYLRALHELRTANRESEIKDLQKVLRAHVELFFTALRKEQNDPTRDSRDRMNTKEAEHFKNESRRFVRKLAKLIVNPVGYSGDHDVLGMRIGTHPSFGTKSHSWRYESVVDASRGLLGWVAAKENRHAEKELARKIEDEGHVEALLDVLFTRLHARLRAFPNNSGILEELKSGRTLLDDRPFAVYLNWFSANEPLEHLRTEVWERGGILEVLETPHMFGFRDKMMVMHDLSDYFREKVSRSPVTQGTGRLPLPKASDVMSTTGIDDSGRRTAANPERGQNIVRDREGRLKEAPSTRNENARSTILARSLNIPVWSGQSHTALRMFHMARFFGASRHEVAALAWGIFAFWRLHYDHTSELAYHTLHETLDIAHNFGVPYSMKNQAAGLPEVKLENILNRSSYTAGHLEGAAKDAFAALSITAASPSSSTEAEKMNALAAAIRIGIRNWQADPRRETVVAIIDNVIEGEQLLKQSGLPFESFMEIPKDGEVNTFSVSSRFGAMVERYIGSGSGFDTESPAARALLLPRNADNTLSENAVQIFHDADEEDFDRMWEYLLQKAKVEVAGENKSSYLPEPATLEKFPELQSYTKRSDRSKAEDYNVPHAAMTRLPLRVDKANFTVFADLTEPDDLTDRRIEQISEAVRLVQGAGFSVPNLRVYLPKYGRSIRVRHDGKIDVLSGISSTFFAPDILVLSPDLLALRHTSSDDKTYPIELGVQHVITVIEKSVRYANDASAYYDLTFTRFAERNYEDIARKLPRSAHESPLLFMGEYFLGAVTGQQLPPQTTKVYKKLGGVVAGAVSGEATSSGRAGDRAPGLPEGWPEAENTEVAVASEEPWVKAMDAATHAGGATARPAALSFSELELLGSGVVRSERWLPFGTRRGERRAGAAEAFSFDTRGGRRVLGDPDAGERTDVGYQWSWYKGQEFEDGLVVMTRRIHLVGRVRDEERARVMNAAAWGLERVVNAHAYRLPLPDQVTGPLQGAGPVWRAEVRFVDHPDEADAVVSLTPGGRISQKAWPVNSSPWALAHEIVHGMAGGDTEAPAETLLTPGGRTQEDVPPGKMSLMGRPPRGVVPGEDTLVITKVTRQQIADHMAPWFHRGKADPTSSTGTASPGTTVTSPTVGARDQPQATRRPDQPQGRPENENSHEAPTSTREFFTQSTQALLDAPNAAAPSAPWDSFTAAERQVRTDTRVPVVPEPLVSHVAEADVLESTEVGTVTDGLTRSMAAPGEVASETHPLALEDLLGVSGASGHADVLAGSGEVDARVVADGIRERLAAARIDTTIQPVHVQIHSTPGDPSHWLTDIIPRAVKELGYGLYVHIAPGNVVHLCP
ncbi:hypothetical protein [Actinacidiphila sp. bgisy167]|uniref:hypothetical protein n=1 Tax=Actinacidiphila sp. bgisy167 TaxID=3413797 RepID=UPI003D748B5B